MLAARKWRPKSDSSHAKEGGEFDAGRAIARARAIAAPHEHTDHARGTQNLCRIPACTISCFDVDDRSGAPGMSAWSSDEPVASPATFWYAPIR